MEDVGVFQEHARPRVDGCPPVEGEVLIAVGLGQRGHGDRERGLVKARGCGADVPPGDVAVELDVAHPPANSTAGLEEDLGVVVPEDRAHDRLRLARAHVQKERDERVARLVALAVDGRRELDRVDVARLGRALRAVPDEPAGDLGDDAAELGAAELADVQVIEVAPAAGPVEAELALQGNDVASVLALVGEERARLHRSSARTRTPSSRMGSSGFRSRSGFVGAGCPL